MTKPFAVRLSSNAVTVTVIRPSPNINPEDTLSFPPTSRTGMVSDCCLFIRFSIPPVTEKLQSTSLS